MPKGDFIITSYVGKAERAGGKKIFLGCKIACCLLARDTHIWRRRMRERKRGRRRRGRRGKRKRSKAKVGGWIFFFF